MGGFSGQIVCVICYVAFSGFTSGRIHPKTIATPSTTATSATTTIPENVTIVTETPGKKINYTLDLNNNGPVALDARIIFEARLLNKRGKIAQANRFRYDWNNNADKKFHSAEDDLENSYIYNFKSADTKSGSWVMTVAVYGGKGQQEIMNFGSMQFVLTETLNGALHMKQTLEYQRNENIYSANKKIELLANHTDDFSHLVPMYSFYWYQNDRFIHYTEEPYLNHTIFDEGNFTLQVEVLAIFDEFDTKESVTPLRLRTSTSCDSARVKRRSRDLADKCGVFSHHITIKKPLQSVDILGSRSAAIGEYITVNVTCQGSNPSAVCWNMTAMNSSQPSLNVTCVPEEFKDTCTHTVRIKLTEMGWRTVWFTVYNDVSYLSTPFNVYAYDPHSVNVPALTIPIVFCTLGALVVIIGSLYLNRLRKKPTIEVADFDFHSSVENNPSPNMFYRLANKIRTTWHGRKNTFNRLEDNVYRRPNYGTDYRNTTAKSYGSTNIHESL